MRFMNMLQGIYESFIVLFLVLMKVLSFYFYANFQTREGMCLDSNCLLYNTANLIWKIYVRKEIPQKIREMNLNREIVCDYHHILEKVRFYLPNVSGEELTSWNTFYFLMKELYKKLKRHCVE